MRSKIARGIAGAGLGALLVTGAVWAATTLIGGTLGLVKSGTLVKGVHKGSFTLPTSVGGAFLTIVDTGSNTQTFNLPGGGWKQLGKPTKPKGFKFKGSPCSVVLVKTNVIKYVCKEGITLTTPLSSAMGAILNVGDQRFCARFPVPGAIKNDAKLFKAKNAPVPSACPGSPSGAFLD